MVRAQPTLEEVRSRLERALVAAEAIGETYLCALIETALQAVYDRLRQEGSRE